MPDIDIDAIRAKLGTKIVDEDEATAAPLRGMVVTFDRDEKPPVKGEPVAPGWHLAYFSAASRLLHWGWIVVVLVAVVLSLTYPAASWAQTDGQIGKVVPMTTPRRCEKMPPADILAAADISGGHIAGDNHIVTYFDVIPAVSRLPRGDNLCLAHLMTSKGEFAWIFRCFVVNGKGYIHSVTTERWSAFKDGSMRLSWWVDY